MKKLIAFFMMMIFLMSIAFAVTTTTEPIAGFETKGFECKDCNTQKVVTTLRVAEKQKEFNEKEKIVGLENAYLRVKENSTAQAMILKNIQKHRIRLAILKNVTVEEQDDGTVVATGINEGKFLGIFKMKKQYSYVLTADKMERKKKAFDFLWSGDLTTTTSTTTTTMA